MFIGIAIGSMMSDSVSESTKLLQATSNDSSQGTSNSEEKNRNVFLFSLLVLSADIIQARLPACNEPGQQKAIQIFTSGCPCGILIFCGGAAA